MRAGRSSLRDAVKGHCGAAGVCARILRVSKSKKHLRACPVLGRDITSAECGEGRGSVNACPAECPFFPFTPANYDQHGEIESRLISKTYDRATKLMSPAERERMLDEIENQQGNEVLANHSRLPGSTTARGTRGGAPLASAGWRIAGAG